MTCIRWSVFCALTLAVGGVLRAQEPSAAEIMAHVAANQDQAEAARAHYVYIQHARMTSRKGKSVMCEEITDYRMTPSADASQADLLKVDGRLLRKQSYIAYKKLLVADEDKDHGKEQDKEKNTDKKLEQDSRASDQTATKPIDNTRDNGQPDNKSTAAEHAVGPATKATDNNTPKAADDDPGDSIDRDLVENIRKSLLNDKSKDGIDAHLFPLTTKAQADYSFVFEGRDKMNGHDVYHIRFRPKDKKDFGWQGDAYIDTAAYQPVLVTTGMSRKIPFAVRTLMGINFPGLGFTVTYAPQPDGPWFPVTLSTEFKIEVLFFFRREIILNAENREFEKTHGETRILEGATPVEPEKH